MIPSTAPPSTAHTAVMPNAAIATNAAAARIHWNTFIRLCFASFTAVTIIRPHTAAFMPVNAPSIYEFSPIAPRNDTTTIIMMNDGATTPRVAASAPFTPYILLPIYVALFIATTPGSDCATAMQSSMSSSDIHFLSSTTTCCICGIIAMPPPIVKIPTLKNSQKRIAYFFMLFIFSRFSLSIYIAAP